MHDSFTKSEVRKKNKEERKQQTDTKEAGETQEVAAKRAAKVNETSRDYQRLLISCSTHHRRLQRQKQKKHGKKRWQQQRKECSSLLPESVRQIHIRNTSEEASLSFSVSLSRAKSHLRCARAVHRPSSPSHSLSGAECGSRTPVSERVRASE